MFCWRANAGHFKKIYKTCQHQHKFFGGVQCSHGGVSEISLLSRGLLRGIPPSKVYQTPDGQNREFSLCSPRPILDSIVVSIPACHAGDRGSIPRRGGFFLSMRNILSYMPIPSPYLFSLAVLSPERKTNLPPEPAQHRSIFFFCNYFFSNTQDFPLAVNIS